MISMIKNKRILITGSRGFIGSTLAKRLAEDNYITHLDLSYGNNILNTYELFKAVSGCQIVIHTAARVGVSEVLQDTIATMQVNYTGTANVLLAALVAQCEQVVCFSTSEIFGVNANWVAEHGTPTFPDAGDPRWCYALSKLAAEHLAMGYYRQHGLPVTIVRPFNVFGEGRTGNHVLLHFIRAALEGRELTVYGTGEQIRAWCHIDDFCDGVLAMLGNTEAIGKAFNIGNPVNVITVKDLADTVIYLCQSESRVVYKPLLFADIDIRIPDISLAQKVLGFDPGINLLDGLLRTIGWARENFKK